MDSARLSALRAAVDRLTDAAGKPLGIDPDWIALRDAIAALDNLFEWAEYMTHRFKVYDGGSAILAIAEGRRPPLGETLEDRLLARVEAAEAALEVAREALSKVGALSRGVYADGRPFRYTGLIGQMALVAADAIAKLPPRRSM